MTAAQDQATTIAPSTGSNQVIVEDCEWVDDAVLSLSAVFSMCHAHDYAQLEFEHKAQGVKQGQHWRVPTSEEAIQRRSILSTASQKSNDSSMEDEFEGFEATKLAKPKACVLENHGRR